MDRSIDIMAATAAREEVRKEFGEGASVQTYADQFIGHFHYFLKNPKLLQERYAPKEVSSAACEGSSEG